MKKLAPVFTLLLFSAAAILFTTHSLPFKASAPARAQTCQDGDDICPEGCSFGDDKDCFFGLELVERFTFDEPVDTSFWQCYHNGIVDWSECEASVETVASASGREGVLKIDKTTTGLTAVFPDDYGEAFLVRTSFYDTGTAPSGIHMSLTSNQGEFDGTQEGVAVGLWTDQFGDKISYFHTGNEGHLYTYIDREPGKWHELVIAVTPEGSYAMYDGANLATLPNTEDAKALYKGHEEFVRLNIGNLFPTEGTYYYDDIEIWNIPEKLDAKEISKYFLEQSIEKDYPPNNLWKASSYSLSNKYLGTDYSASEIDSLVISWLSTFNPRDVKDWNARKLNHQYVNGNWADPWLIWSTWSYLGEGTRDLAEEKLAGLSNLIVDKYPPSNTNSGFPGSPLYSYCPDDGNFPYSSWRDEGSVENLGWPASFLALNYLMFPDHPRALEWRDLARALGYHTLNKGVVGDRSLEDTGRSYPFVKDKFLEWESKSIYEDALSDNHNFHPHPHYALGALGVRNTLLATQRIVGRSLWPEFQRFNQDVYRSSVVDYLDDVYWRWKPVQRYEWTTITDCDSENPVPGNWGELVPAQDNPGGRPQLGFSGLTDWGTAPYYWHCFELASDKRRAEAVAEFSYYVLNQGSGIFTCGFGPCGFEGSVAGGSIFSEPIMYLLFAQNSDYRFSDDGIGPLTCENMNTFMIWGGDIKSGCVDINGREALKMKAEPGANAEAYTYLIPVEPGQKYEVSYDIKTEDLTPEDAEVYGKVIVSRYNEFAQEEDATDQNRIAVGKELGENMQGTNEWTHKEYIFATEPGVSYIRLRAMIGGWGKASGMVWFDDVKIEKVTLTPKDLLSRYGTGDAEADLNGDGLVNGMDFGEMVKLVQASN